MIRETIDATRCCACCSSINDFPSSRSCGRGILCFSCFYAIAQRSDRSELAHYGIRREAIEVLRDDHGELLPPEIVKYPAGMIFHRKALGERSNTEEALPLDHGDGDHDRA